VIFSLPVLTFSHPIYQLPWAEVKKEMTEEKGLDPVVADKIGEYVKHKGKFVFPSYSLRRSN
jgi:histidyl-tRNA synthetase